MAVSINGTNGLIQAYDYQVLTTGFSYTFAAGTQTLVINPAGTLATGTITMPAAPSDGMTITFSSTKEITALTLNGNTGQTIVSGTSSMAAGSSVTYLYRSAITSWFPLQSVPSAANTQLGVGQTWQDVTASRALGTTYTNTTSKPIFVGIRQTSTGAGGFNGPATVAGVSMAYPYNYAVGSGYYCVTNFIVPPGATYSCAASSSTLGQWIELR